MINYYSTKNVNAISLIISIIVFFLINSIWTNTDKIKFKVSFNSNQIQENVISSDTTIEKEISITQETTKEKSNWTIEIPSINLYAEIAEGTTKEVMDEYVGHFTETSTREGNVGLAAHNRGYKVNYFQNLKELEYGAEIIYKNKDFEKVYVVETIEIIKNTDWTYLEKTEENKITLITCVENMPEYRRCIQGEEKTESEEFKY